jgi:hypothetical protein
VAEARKAVVFMAALLAIELCFWAGKRERFVSLSCSPVEQ